MRSLAVIEALVLLAACSGGKEDDAEQEAMDAALSVCRVATG